MEGESIASLVGFVKCFQAADFGGLAHAFAGMSIALLTFASLKFYKIIA